MDQISGQIFDYYSGGMGSSAFNDYMSGYDYYG